MKAEPIDFNALLTQCKQQLQEGQKRIRDAYLAAPDASRFLRERCRLTDEALCTLWHKLGFPASLALIAVGGYGRGELYPASDVDLLILLPKSPDAALTAKLEQLVSLFWDIGLEIGHSVRTIEECLAEATNDITVQTAMIEARLLTGSDKLFKKFSASIKTHLDPRAFFHAKRMEQDERHLRYQETAFSLEPNCKESPGGLRDLQAILWIARAAGFGSGWQDLERHGFITHEEEQHLERCEKFLQNLRTRMHIYLGRREDRLLFDYQTALAQQLGFETTPTKRASEQLMQEYYRTAKTVTQINTILLQNIGAAIFPPPDQAPQAINERFQNAHDLLDAVHENVFNETPSAILESFLLLLQHPELKGIKARTLRALWRARTRIDDDFRRDPKNRALFLELFKQPRGLTRVFRRMNQFGILGRYLPCFSKIVGQMQHDLFHVYTVDQHIMEVMRNLHRFTLDEFAHEYPLCSRLISDFNRPWVLYIAALFHDIAKGRGGNHSELGTVDAQEFCDAHALDAEDSELIVWLVRQHLVMSNFAQKQDISDPDVVAAFAALMRDERHLTALYLFTVADIRGTSPKVWNTWKGQLLEQLFNATRNLLSSGGAAPAAQGILQERQKEAMRLLRYFALSDSVHERLWKQLDTVYFLRHSAEEIAWHTSALHYRIHIDQPVVKARINPQGGLEVMVYTRDQPDLFARLLGFFGRAGYSIVEAKIQTTRHGYALDTFMLLDAAGGEIGREVISYIEHELNKRLIAQTPPEAPLNKRVSRQVKHFPIQPTVTIQPDEKGQYFVLSVTAADRPGLLYTVATTLAAHHANLHTAKISTLGERVEDTFLISGSDINESAQRIRLETELLAQLQL